MKKVPKEKKLKRKLKKISKEKEQNVMDKSALAWLCILDFHYFNSLPMVASEGCVIGRHKFRESICTVWCWWKCLISH